MATLNFGTTDRKVFTPVSSALANLPNGPGTMLVLVKTPNTANQDLVGLTNSGLTSWYHAFVLGDFSGPPPGLTGFGDDTINGVAGPAYPVSTTNWYLMAVDWGTGDATERFHYRNQTGLSAWTHGNSINTNGGLRAGPGTGGWLRLGYFGDYNFGTKDLAVCAIWAGTRFADGDYGSWTKTSDLYSHALGPPTFLCELSATTLVDLIGGSTYSSGNSSGTTLTGADPVNWTMDGIGAGVAPTVKKLSALGVG